MSRDTNQVKDLFEGRAVEEEGTEAGEARGSQGWGREMVGQRQDSWGSERAGVAGVTKATRGSKAVK